MPAAICIIASVMMKEGMPIIVSPTALTTPSAKQATSASRIASAARQRHVGDVDVGFLQREIGDHDAGRVGDGGHRQVDLGAQDDEGQADRDDRRSPRPGSGCCRGWRGSRRRGWRRRRRRRGQRSVTKGAMLRIWPFSQAPAARAVRRLRAVELRHVIQAFTLHAASSSRSLLTSRWRIPARSRPSS